VDIRDGVKFHDGTELTAEDVLWTWQWGMGVQAQEYATGGACLSNSQLTETMELTGPDQVQVGFNTVFLDFEDDFGSAGGNWIGTVYQAGLGEGTDVLHDEAVEAAFDRAPIGAGPYKLVNHVASDKMEFERFDDHYYHPDNGFNENRRPQFSALELRLVPEVATRVAALRAGEADVAPVSLGAKDQIEAGGGRLLYGEEGAHFFARLLGCWETHLPCHDIKVRHALNYAVDRESMQKHLFGGPDVFQVKGFNNVTPSTIGYSPEVDPFPYDPDKARELLAEAGYKTPDNPDGKDFGQFIINTWQSAAVPNLPDAAQFVAETWQNELGIDATVRVSEESAVKKATRLTEDWYGQVLFRDNETRLDASSLLNGGYGRNKDRPDRASRDPEVVALAEEIRVLIDPAVRVPRLTEFYIRARNESNELFMGYVNIPWGVGPRVLTWEPSPMAFYVNETHTITLAD
jgi:peptide/nickel transport system substrate-binding protein